MSKLHYELTGETKTLYGGTVVCRIRATRDLPHRYVKAGDLGGFVEHVGNLQDQAWVGDDAVVYGNARVYGNAMAAGNARMYDNARVSGNAQVCSVAQVYGLCTGVRQRGGVWSSKQTKLQTPATKQTLRYPGRDHTKTRTTPKRRKRRHKRILILKEVNKNCGTSGALLPIVSLDAPGEASRAWDCNELPECSLQLE